MSILRIIECLTFYAYVFVSNITDGSSSTHKLTRYVNVTNCQTGHQFSQIAFYFSSDVLSRKTRDY